MVAQDASEGPRNRTPPAGLGGRCSPENMAVNRLHLIQHSCIPGRVRVKTFKKCLCVYAFLKRVLFQAQVVMESITFNVLTCSVEHFKVTQSTGQLCVEGTIPQLMGK